MFHLNSVQGLGVVLTCVMLLSAIQCSIAHNETVSIPSEQSGLLNFFSYDFGTENPYREFNQWINSFFFSDEFVHTIEKHLQHTELSYYFICYFRDFIAGTCVYWMTASVWHFVIYSLYGVEIFTDNGRPFPTWETLKDQMIVAQWSIFIYAGLPVFSEFLIESGYTKVYFYIR